MVPEKDNLTLSCLVSQRKRSGSVLILRWFFAPHAGPTYPPPPSPSPAAPQPSQFLIAKLGIRKLKLYGNYTRRFPQPKFRLFEEKEGEMYRLWILNVTLVDQGFYTCRVQEIRKHRNTWRASSNGTSTMQLTGRPNRSCQWDPLRMRTTADWLAAIHIYIFSILEPKMLLLVTDQDSHSIYFFKISSDQMRVGLFLLQKLSSIPWRYAVTWKQRCSNKIEASKGQKGAYESVVCIFGTHYSLWICAYVFKSSGISMSKQWAHTVKPPSTISLCVVSVRTKKVECCWAGYVWKKKKKESETHDISTPGLLLCKPQEKV